MTEYEPDNMFSNDDEQSLYKETESGVGGTNALWES